MTCQSQQELLVSFLKEYVNHDYVYLDLPAHLNVGDMLIAMGAMCLLKQVPHACIHKSTYANNFDDKIPDDAVILMHGGGNFGNLYPGANWYRRNIVGQHPMNRIIILPNTVTYTNLDLLKEDVDILNSHPDLHICARDNDSYVFLKEHFTNAHIYLLPDTAMGLYGHLPEDRSNARGTLTLLRKDAESVSRFSSQDSSFTGDWKDVLDHIGFGKILFGFRLLKKIRQYMPCAMTKELHDWYLTDVEYPYVRSRVTGFFNSFETVCTDRLHGYILSSLLNIPVQQVQDTKYAKIANYRNTWMNDD